MSALASRAMALPLSDRLSLSLMMRTVTLRICFALPRCALGEKRTFAASSWRGRKPYVRGIVLD